MNVQPTRTTRRLARSVREIGAAELGGGQLRVAPFHFDPGDLILSSRSR